MQIHPFDQLMELPASDIRLDCACLHYARDVYSDLNVFRSFDYLDSLANEVLELRPGLASPQRYDAMHEVLVGRHGFTGNSDDYYDPANSYLNQVLERRLGIPITLSIVWIEVGRRLNWPLYGVGFPGHFLVRFDDPDRFLIADPFAEGRALSAEDCEQLLHAQFDGKVKFDLGLLDPIDNRAILTRCLHNLRQLYRVNHDYGRLEDVLRRLMALDSGAQDYRLELAQVRQIRNDPRAPLRETANYLNHAPDNDDAAMTMTIPLKHSRTHGASLN